MGRDTKIYLKDIQDALTKVKNIAVANTKIEDCILVVHPDMKDKIYEYIHKSNIDIEIIENVNMVKDRAYLIKKDGLEIKVDYEY